MPVFNRIVNEGQGVQVTYKDTITVEEVLKAQAERSTPTEKLTLNKYHLHDLSLVDHFTLTSEEVRKVAESAKKTAKINPNLVVAAITPKDLYFGMARMYGSYAESTGWEMKAFRSRGEAESWVKKRVQERFNLVFDTV